MKKTFFALSLMVSGSAFAATDPNAYSIQNPLMGATTTVQASANNGAGVVFGVIDTGVAAPWIGFSSAYNKVGLNNIDTVNSHCMIAGCPASLAVNDDNGHGTFVSSEIVGNIGGAGMRGVAPAGKVIAVKVLDSTGSGSGTDIVNGIVYAVNHGANVLNLSLGPGGTAPEQAGFYQSLGSALNYAASKNVIVVFAGGNSKLSFAGGLNVMGLTDAAIKRIILVGSTDASQQVSTFSNRPGGGSFVSNTGQVYNYYKMWLMADGEDIWGASNYHTAQYGYSYITQMSGTSMAAPQVAGAAGLLAARWPFMLAQGTIPQLLEQTAQDIGKAGADGVTGLGYVRVDLAMQPVGSMSVPVGGKLVPVAASKVVAGGALGDMSKMSSALQHAVGYDSYMRGFPIVSSSMIVSKGSATSTSAATHQVMGETGASSMHFSSLADGSSVAFSGTPYDSNEWSYGFSRDGNYMGMGQGSNAAWSFNAARWGGENAFSNTDVSASGSLLGLVSDGSFAAVGMKTGARSRVAMSLVTTQSPMDNSPVTSEADARGGAFAYTLQPGSDWKLSLSTSFLQEKNRFLGSLSSGYLGLAPSASSFSVGVGSDIGLGSGFRLGFDASYATTDSSQNQTSLIQSTSRLGGYSFSAGLTKDDVTGIGDTLGFSVDKPLRIYSGSANLAVPVDTDNNGNPIIRFQRVGMSPSGNETDLAVAYGRPLGDDMLSKFNLTYRNDADNVAGAQDVAAMAHFQLNF